VYVKYLQPKFEEEKAEVARAQIGHELNQQGVFHTLALPFKLH
jgi:hypothetical protein